MLELLVQTKTGTSNLASTVVTFDNNTVAGNSIVVIGGNSSSTAGDISGVTDSQGNVYSKDNATANATIGEIEIWHTSGIIGGANTVTVAYTTGVACAVVIREYNGLIYSSSLDKQVGNTGNSNSLSSGNTTSLAQTNELLVGAGLIPLANNFTAGSGFVNLVSTGAPLVVAVAAEDQFVTTGGVRSATFTADSSIQWVCVLATYFLLPTGTTTSTSSTSVSSTSTSSTSSSISSTSSSTSSTSTSTSSTSTSLSTSSTSTSLSSTSSSISSTSSSTSSTSTSSTSSSTSISSTSSSISSTSTSSTSISSTSSSISISSTSSSFSSTSSSISSTSASTSSTSFSSTSSSSSTSSTTLPPPYYSFSYQDSLTTASPLSATFENTGHISGDTIATSDTGSATKWNTVSPGSGDTITYDSAHAYGTLSANFTTGVTGNTSFIAWTSGTVGTITEHYGRIYLYMTANPATSALGVIRARSGSTLAGRMSITTAGKVLLVDSNSTSQGQTTNAIALNQWVRIEYHFVHSVTNGYMELKLFNNADSTQVTEFKRSTMNINTLASANELSYGPVAGTNASYTIWIDNIIGNADNWPGPQGAAGALNPFTITNSSDILGDDGDYFIEYGSEYMIREYKQIHQNNTDNISFTWRGRTTISTLSSPMYIQIYNVSTSAWETLAVANKVPADTDFSATVSQTSNVANYYDVYNTVAFRSYQQVL